MAKTSSKTKTKENDFFSTENIEARKAEQLAKLGFELTEITVEGKKVIAAVKL